MRIAELSRRAGVSVPTIKFYLREGLLAPGTHTSRNQATYDDSHERRLRLVRALIDVGGLSIAAVRQVLRTLDAPVVDVRTLLAEVQRQLVAAPVVADDPMRPWAEGAVAQMIARRGWAVHPEHPAAKALACVLITAARLGYNDFLNDIEKYAVACEDLAAIEMESLRPSAEELVQGAILGDAAVNALRRLAQGDAAHRRYGRADRTG